MNKDYKFKTIIFDFDGTIIDSSKIKTDAFEDLYKHYGKEVASMVVKFHLENQGISRYKKFEFFEKNILKKKYSQETEMKLDKQFSSIVLNKIIKAKYISGAYEFLDSYHKEFNFYLISATPEKELKKIVRKKNIEYYFRGIYGSPLDKGKVIQNILKVGNLSNKTALMIGDSQSDLEAATLASVSFLGISSENNSGIFEEVPKLKNFYNLIDYLKYKTIIEPN